MGSHCGLPLAQRAGAESLAAFGSHSSLLGNSPPPVEVGQGMAVVLLILVGGAAAALLTVNKRRVAKGLPPLFGFRRL